MTSDVNGFDWHQATRGGSDRDRVQRQNTWGRPCSLMVDRLLAFGLFVQRLARRTRIFCHLPPLVRSDLAASSLPPYRDLKRCQELELCRCTSSKCIRERGVCGYGSSRFSRAPLLSIDVTDLEILDSQGADYFLEPPRLPRV